MSRTHVAVAGLITLLVIGLWSLVASRAPSAFPEYRDWQHKSAACNDLKIVVTVYKQTPDALPVIEFVDQQDRMVRVWYFSKAGALVSIPTLKNGATARILINAPDDELSRAALRAYQEFIEPDTEARAVALYHCDRITGRLQLELAPAWF
jgi:hypothetical protein